MRCTEWRPRDVAWQFDSHRGAAIGELNRWPPMRISLLADLATLLSATQSFAKVASIQFSNLVVNCELIVVGKVESLSSPLIGKRYAKARVTEVSMFLSVFN